MSNRIWYDNKVHLATTTITVSSEQPSNPLSHLRDQQPQKTWRGKVGWTVTEDNRRIDGNRGGGGPGNFTAVIALGNYPTPTLYAEAVRAALAAADPGVLWAVDYNVAATDCFRIRDANGAPLNFDLLFTSGANAYRSAHRDLGYSNPDKTGASTYTASLAVYQSRQFIRLSDPVNGLSATCFAVLQHNFVSGSFNSLTIEAHTSDVWSAPTLVFSGGDPSFDPIYAYITDPIKSYWRITINNTQDPSGFTEVGVLYLGTYVQPPFCIAVDFGAQEQPFTTTKDGISGVRFHNVQPSRDVWTIGWKTITAGVSGLPVPGLQPDEFFVNVTVGENFFFDFDIAGSAQLAYVSREARSWNFVPFQYRDYVTTIVEAI